MNIGYVHLCIKWKNDVSNKIYYYQTCAAEQKLSDLNTLIENKLFIPVKYQRLSYQELVLDNPLLRLGSIDRNNRGILTLVLENTRPQSNNTLEFTVILTHKCKYGMQGSRFGVAIYEDSTFCELSRYLQDFWSLEEKSLLYLSDGKYYNYNSVQPVSTVLNEKMELYLAILDTS